ncbi:MAG: hypothetical protein CR986_01600 [Ignavibacteriae bacterium]|nr:MAG: hypothetical protein CR986_01600 [Ignavibacteriota bacterium]
MADYSLLQDPEMTEIFDSFIIETKETLESLDLNLVELENNPEDADLLNKIFRSFHTVKGTSGFLGLVKMQKLTHRLEDILNKLRKGESKLNSKIMDGILNGYDKLGDLLEIIEENKNEDLDTEEVINELQKIIEVMENGGDIEDKQNAEASEELTDEKNVTEAASEETIEIAEEEEEIDANKFLENFDEEEIQKAFIANNKKMQAANKSSLAITTEEVVTETITKLNPKFKKLNLNR